MIPSVVARQTRETVLDYLRTTFALADDRFEQALFTFLDGEHGLFRGPYLDVRLPFRTAPAGTAIPLDVAPPFTPYLHQLRAFERLTSRGTHTPEPTLVTTGTGSGKTECFLYPVLDHCFRHRGERGIKAILLYPMNALASDQARRLAQMLWDDPRLKGHVRAGLFVGGDGEHGTATRDHLVDQRAILRQSPPDILLTNYRMLDFLLLRPEDQALWQHNEPGTLRYLVLDELHTYDGAQGSDVACLIRRLQVRLGAGPGTICPVGTSATIGGRDQEESAVALRAFAQQIFGVPFDAASVVTEDRKGMVEVLGSDVDEAALPRPDAALDAKNAQSLDDWLALQVRTWLPALAAAPLDPVAVGEALRRHGFLRQVLRALDGRLSSYAEVDAWLCAREEGWRQHAVADRHLLLDSFLGLVSFARVAVERGGAKRLEPFLTVQVQLWLRELRHLVQRVAAEPEFAWASDGAPPGAWLPIAHCRSCGTAGWAAVQRPGESRLQTDQRDINRAWFHRERSCCFVVPGHGAVRELFVDYLEPGRLQLERCAPDDPRPDHLPVHLGRDLSDRTPQRFLARCPDCDADGRDGLSMLASRAASLLSVAISHLFQTDYNQDKKLLAFTDSVQDASHRASFFAARTYRFNLRTAIQGVLEERAGDVPLVDVPELLLGWVASRPHGSPAKALATLWPADLVEFAPYQAWLDGGDASEELLDALRERVSWEVVMEYGFAARIGRTLERSGCSTVVMSAERLAAAANLLALELAEGDVLDAPLAIDAATVRHFLAGLLQRLRTQGGVDHALLRRYVEHQGHWLHLTKGRQPLLSPFGSQSRLPRFLCDVPPDGRTVFTSFAAGPDKWTWHRDWAARALGADRKDRGVVQLYRRALQRLAEHGLVAATEMQGGGRAYGLRWDALAATRAVERVGCPVCQGEEPVPAAQVDAWSGRACLRYRCTGRLERRGAGDDSYYARRYRSGRVERIFAHEHTGLLAREEREWIEEQFKAPTRPDAPNLFVCTPTLEMGVDIGDLSATVLCSVPPTTAKFLQRVGRAGRKTGNALCVTMAEEQPHDLYFQAEPTLMMRGQVLPPGCFLDAPEMLRRQLVAFAMDQWARQETELRAIPPRANLVLGEDGAARFPGRFLAFYRAHAAAIVDAFFATFGGAISAGNQQRLREFAGVQNVEATVRGAFDRLRAEREELRLAQRRTRERLQQLDEDPERFDDPAAERRDLEASQRLLARLVAELGQKYPLNVLTDAGVLPNYAFPEPGVTLKALLRDPNAAPDERNVTQEYTRSASTAIRELAPWNTFYADGRKHVIQELDLGSRTKPLHAPWRLCAECHHLERVLPDAPIATQCPACGDARWSDQGQVKQLVRFERVRSLQTRLEAAVGDDGDDRTEAHYQVEDLIDVTDQNRDGARVAAHLPFGIELLKDLPLREINFGNVAERGTGNVQFPIAGRTIEQDGFRACVDCGRVRDPERQRLDHVPWCPGRRGPAQERLETVLLYREVRSEAIRVLLPIAEFDRERLLNSFKAALELGFRRRFAGDPRHLQVRLHDEPFAGEGRRRFLVVFDTVPGGTGYLSELWHGDHFRDVLALALAALEQCACQRRDPPAAGCYQCLYAYQVQRDLEHLSNRDARGLLHEILAAWPQLVASHTLSDVSLAQRLESELERFFLAELEAEADRRELAWNESVRGGEVFWTLRVGERTWAIHAQQRLGPGDGVAVPCQPDFVIRPQDGDGAVLPVAVFCDGLAYHACPQELRGRIADDVEKRTAILQSGTWLVWNVTWKDVVELQQQRERSSVDGLFAALDGAKLGAVWQQARITLPRSVLQLTAVQMLFAYLATPDAGAWRHMVDRAALVWLAEGRPLAPAASNELENKVQDEPRRFAAGPLQHVERGGTQLARFHAVDWFAALGRCATSEVRADRLAPLRVYLRLFDEAVGRADAAFEASWRAFLQSWNLLQFHPGCRVVTSEGIAEGGEVVPAVEVAGAAVAAEPRDARATILADVSEGLRPLVAALLARGAAAPVAGYELFQGARVAGMAELAWPDAQVAVLVGEQQLDADAFRAAGWTLCAPVEAELAEALTLRPPQEKPTP
jgi:DEAD/DEAH box helicase domain-containing protein